MAALRWLLSFFLFLFPLTLACIPTVTPDDMYDDEMEEMTTTSSTSTTTTTTTTTTSYICPSGWMLNPDNDFCYWLNTDSLAFDDAEAICAMTTGGHLASVVNQAEEDFIYNLAAGGTTGSQSIWLGLMQDPGTGDWNTPVTWTDGTPYTYMTSFDAWAGGEPNGMGGGFCARLYVRFAFDMMWDDDACTTGDLSVCKAPRILVTG